MDFHHLAAQDPKVLELIRLEERRQEEHIELIASENFVSEAVLEATGSVLTNKYAEGYPGKRYYGGCEFVDMVEDLARERLKELFGAEHANVQPHSGANANIAVYFAALKPGDKVLGMNLSEGGHLTHGSPVNLSGMYFNFVDYGVDPVTELIDYDVVREIALREQPKLIVAGATAYPRTIDFKRFKDIADEVGAYLMVDIAHIAGLVATGIHPSPVPYADFVTTTTHKTLRGPRGAVIMCKAEHAKMIDKAVFPGLQGGPLEHTIAAKAVSLGEALKPEFRAYCEHIVENAQVLAQTLKEEGLRLVTDGTDNHLMLVDVTPFDMTGKEAERLLEDVNITTNKNTIPNDQKSPFVTSGLRLGTPAVTTRGMGTEEMKTIGRLIATCLKGEESPEEIKRQVLGLTARFPVYKKA